MPFSMALNPSEVKINATLGLAKINLYTNKIILFNAKKDLMSIFGAGLDN